MSGTSVKNDPKKILLIGNGNSIYIKNFIQYILIPYNFRICLFTDLLENKKHKSFYCENKIDVIERKRTFPLIKNIPLLRVIEDVWQIKAYIKKSGQTDIAHIHYASRLNAFLIPFLKHRGCKTLITYWGSDLLRKGKRYVKSLKRFLAYTDIITFNTKESVKIFNKIFHNKFAEKVYNVKFGSTLFELIDENKISESPQEAGKNIQLPQNKMIIVCGHTRSKEHRQLEVLKQINRMDTEILKNLCIVFPMTYGQSDEVYEKELADYSKHVPCKVRFYREYMSEEDIARLRRSADIFIHAQTSDAFSATLQEFLYAGAVVLNGSWLKYPDLMEAGVKYFEFDGLEQLPDKLQALISGFGEIKDTMRSNRDKIRRLASWEVVAGQWIKLYQQS